MGFKIVAIGVAGAILINKYREDALSSLLLLGGLSYNLTEQLINTLAPLMLSAGRSGKDLNKKGKSNIADLVRSTCFT
jgi:hypothetical protein